MKKWTRRGFIAAGVVAGGGILVGVALRPGNLADDLQETMATDGETLVHAYVKIDAQNMVTAIVPHSELGQGAQTALAQMLAEELDADWEKVRFEEAPAIGEYGGYAIGRGVLLEGVDLPSFLVPSVEGVMMRLADTLDLQITGGSLSVRATGQYGMRIAGAATRDMLKRAASDAWNVPVSEIETADSTLIHPATSRSEPYARFATAAAQMTPSYTPALKDPSQFKIMGRSVERHDIPSKTDGTAQFALDVRLPDMVYASTLRSPVFGARIARLDDTAAKAIDGVIDVLRLPSSQSESMVGGYPETGESVAVVAESYWIAQNALLELDIEWTETGNEAVSTQTIFDQHANDLSSSQDRESDLQVGDTDAALAAADKTIEAEYRVPYLAHTCMEPLNATARIQDGHCEVWVGCQNPLGFRRAIAQALDIDDSNVTLENHFMGGGFGRKSRPDWAIQAALIAREVGRPVQLIWSREEDIRQDFYRPAATSRFRAALESNGTLSAWQNTYVNKQEPVEAPLIPYAVTSQDIGYKQSPSHVPWGAWRSVDESQHGFFVESFVDECAHSAGQDPFAYRAAMLAHKPRHLAVLERVAQEADWDTELEPGRGRGIAFKESFGSITAQVIQVRVQEDQVNIERVVAVIDPGIAVTPDGVKAQIESGVVYGLTAALYGEISIENGAVVQSNFHDYEALRISAAPKIDVHIINSGEAMGGAGEPGTPPAAAALANAIYAATGKRIRELPMAKQFYFAGGGLLA
ncbi:MAG: molybdopterin cofactor-binding domain-containing protein [Pseudomonadota bacterium]